MKRILVIYIDTLFWGVSSLEWPYDQPTWMVGCIDRTDWIFSWRVVHQHVCQASTLRILFLEDAKSDTFNIWFFQSFGHVRSGNIGDAALLLHLTSSIFWRSVLPFFLQEEKSFLLWLLDHFSKKNIWISSTYVYVFTYSSVFFGLLKILLK